MVQRSITLIFILLLAGCATFSKKEDEIKISSPTPGEKALSKIAGPPEHTEGSLWADTTSRPFYFLDLRASHIGDIVTVKVVENAKGTKESETKTARKSSLKMKSEAGSLFGQGPTGLANFGLEAGTEYDNKSDGTGSTSRSGTFIADVPSVITAVLPNGNLVVEGVREVRINSEKEIISLKGIIRPEDIDMGNMVPSNKVADATIEYIGKGVLNDKNHPGWFTRILDWVWPF
jgi:flagellar L-ring protein precursor FlgH